MSRLDRHEGECMVHRGKAMVRNVDLYVIGSEGLNICHDCEMDLVHHIQVLRKLTADARKEGFLVARRGENKQ